MLVTIVHVFVKQVHIDDFIDAIGLNHSNSIKEPGNLRFDVLQGEENPAHFVIYEAYASEQAAADHKKTKHYLEWREKVDSWMDKPRQGFRHRVIFPTDTNQW